MTKKRNLSQGCQVIFDYLKSKNLDYRLEARFTHCKDIKKLPFDFEIIINGRVAVIEFDGEQHFRHIPRFHPTVEAFQKQQNHDRIKTQYCYQHSISLLRIDYTCTTKEKVYPLLDKFIEAVKLGKPVYHFSDMSLYRNHDTICHPSSCVIC